jgi:hypothetical protein
MFMLASFLVFTAAFLLAIGTIGYMLLAYHDKMVAALTFQPMPTERPAIRVQVRRRRVARPAIRPTAELARAVAA